MKAQKWNNETRKYSECELPEKTFLFSDNMDADVACAQCGKMIKYGESFTSREIHSKHGLGYPVCNNCYEIETSKI